MVLATGQQALREEWERANPRTSEEISAFYQTSQHMTDDLDFFHAHPKRQAWTAAIVECARQTGATSVLDVGCGRGDDLKALFEAGVPVAVGIEPNAMLRAQSPVWTYASLDEFAAEYSELRPDLTICIDVLEHLPDPEAFVRQMCAHVPVGGWLVEATATEDVYSPLHLRSNWGWRPNAILRALGFKLREHHDRLNFWQREAEAGKIAATILCCAYRAVAPELATTVARLAERGWNFAFQTNDALINRARSLIVSNWLKESPDDVFLMVDADVTFGIAEAEHIVQVCREKRSIVVGAYAVRDGAHLSSRIFPGEEVTFAPDAEAVPIEHGATGFMAVHRDVVEKLRTTLPLCHPDQRWSFWPFFECYVVNPGEPDCQLLSEDWAFTSRAKAAGFPVYLDPTVRLGHLGLYEWRLEDMAPDRQAWKEQRFPRITVREKDKPGTFVDTALGGVE